MSAPLEYLLHSASGLPIEPQALPAAELSLIGKWRWNLLAALFAALVLVASSVRGWRGSELVERTIGRSARRRLAIVAIAVLVASTGFAVLAWWLPAIPETNADPASDRVPMLADRNAPMDLVQIEGDARSEFRCAQCGVVESTRDVLQSSPIAGSQSGDRTSLTVNSPRAVEVTVRMKDGASHLFIAENSADSARWRPGERVIFIDGRNQSTD